MDRDGKHPEELGEFDVISYLHNKNIILKSELNDNITKFYN